MLLHLVNPANPLVSMSLNRRSYLNRFRLWKPLGLQVLAGLTPPDWEVSILDENLGPIDYERLPRPDVVGITAFTSQANRAYALAARFRARGIPVVMGGIHATMCLVEAGRRVDSVVTGEAESVWAEVLGDVRAGGLKARYDGGQAAMDQIVPARHDLLPRGYGFGSLQTTRGCSLNCTFCSVTEFNGARYRQRPIAEVVEEFTSIPESRVLIVDDNLIGRQLQHIERAKELFRALADARTGKAWIGQTTVNIADDEELLALARQAGCVGLFIGFESVTPEGLPELGKKSLMLSGRDIPASVERIHRHGILVVGSFIMGLDSDRPGVGALIAREALRYGVDNINVLFLTPLPGTRLWKELEAEGRIDMNDFPEDWQYYTLNYPVARYRYLTRSRIIQEMNECNRTFYSPANIFRRLAGNMQTGRSPALGLVSNLTSRRNSARFAQVYAALWPAGIGTGQVAEPYALAEPAGLAGLDEIAAQRLRQFAAALKLQVAALFRQS
jgi:radical SAM superfamily enzyme YgiQ (UPF0313 family)